MDKGIRAGVNFKFNEMLPQLAALGGKAFRRQILDWTVEQYACTMAAASTHYNHAFHAAKAATPEAVTGLGRPADKNNGGRKKKEAVVVIDTPAGDSELTPDLGPVQTEWKVCKKSDGSVVAEGLSLDAAMALVQKAAAAKKAKLYYV